MPIVKEKQFDMPQQKQKEAFRWWRTLKANRYTCRNLKFIPCSYMLYSFLRSHLAWLLAASSISTMRVFTSLKKIKKKRLHKRTSHEGKNHDKGRLIFPSTEGLFKHTVKLRPLYKRHVNFISRNLTSFTRLLETEVTNE